MRTGDIIRNLKCPLMALRNCLVLLKMISHLVFLKVKTPLKCPQDWKDACC